jgi:hypothetical protein
MAMRISELEGRLAELELTQPGKVTAIPATMECLRKLLRVMCFIGLLLQLRAEQRKEFGALKTARPAVPFSSA